SLRLSVKIGDLVRFRSGNYYKPHREWLGLIVREIPGTDEVKIVEWTHWNKGRDRGGYKARDLEVVNEDR
ncbi:MAG: hypothetical protein QF416_11385, partial [Candidatus Marinimicrobia bacterium]|nr:hypothetical protein [Candidatus Neomarinimicrobiota bacterium]